MMDEQTGISAARQALFQKAMCDRLRADETLLARPIQAVREGDLCIVTLTYYLPADEVAAMFNAATPHGKQSHA